MMSEPTRQTFLGLDFDSFTLEGLVDLLRERSEQMPFSYLVTPNVDHMVRLHECGYDDPEHEDIWRAYRSADFCVCDSRVLALLARSQTLRLHVCPGSDLTARLFEEVIRPGDRVNIVGGSAETGALLRKMYPGVRLEQHIPPMGLRRNRAALANAAEFVRHHPARFTFLAVGSPQQELLACQIRSLGDARGTAFCVGAALNFIVGSEKRAPIMMQRLNLEWLHRLASSPGRLWRRYLVDGPRIFRIVRQARSAARD